MLNRPDTLNALTVPATAAVANRLEEAATDRVVRAVVITGAGGAFSRGGDLSFLRELQTACFATRHFAEGVEALADKRSPRVAGA